MSVLIEAPRVVTSVEPGNSITMGGFTSKDSTSAQHSAPDAAKAEKKIAWSTSSRVGIVYDERMMGHRTNYHPECPERISSIFDAHRKEGLVARCREVKSREVTEEEMRYVHTDEYLSQCNRLDQTIQQGFVFEIPLEWNSIYMNKHSVFCAKLSAGSTLNITQAVCTGELDAGIAIVRPPGHHAEAGHAMGFCFLNNVGIAAHMALQNENIKRVLILDWDVHHGNATQHQFYDDPRVCYVSLHRFDQARFFPNSMDADASRTGGADAKGLNVNIAWNTVDRHGKHWVPGDAEYQAAFQRAVIPVAKAFRPDLIIVSAGFDAAAGDPLGGCGVTPGGYADMTAMLHQVCPKIVVVLEGGYNLNAISRSCCAVTHTLLELTSSASDDNAECKTSLSPRGIPDAANEAALRDIQLTIEAHRGLLLHSDISSPTDTTATGDAVDAAGTGHLIDKRDAIEAGAVVDATGTDNAAGAGDAAIVLSPDVVAASAPQ